jgi:hypothetical protein
VALATVGTVVVALVIAVVAVESIDHDGPVVATEAAPDVTLVAEEEPEPTAPPTTTTEPQISITTDPSTPTPGTTPPPDQAVPPVVVPDPAPTDPGGGAPPPAPPAAPTGNLTVSPGSVPTVHPTGSEATVSWTTTGATSVSVSGPGLSSGGASGSQRVCPGTVVTGAGGSVCRSPAGSYTYVLTATGPGGTVQRSVTLTVS